MSSPFMYLNTLSYYQLGLIAIPLLLLLRVYGLRFRRNRRIARLGSSAPVVKTYLPFGIDFPFKTIYAFIKGRAPEAWTDEFKANDSNTVEIRILTDLRVILTVDPENTKAVLASQFSDYGKGVQFHSEWKAFLGDSIFTTDGPRWQASRALLRPFFERQRVADLDLIETHVQELMTHLGPGDGREVEVKNLFFRFSLDASTHFLFGHSAESLRNEHVEFAQAFDDVQRLQVMQGRAGVLGIFIPMRKFHEGLKKMDRFIEPYITEALSMTDAQLEQKTKKEETFLHALARHTKDRKVIRDQLVALLLAGRDTTSCVLSWLFLELARNPRVVARIQQEIAAVVGNGQPGKAPLPTYEQIKSMRYLTHVINETLRLYPVVPFNVRDSLVDTTLPRGGGPSGLDPIGIPAGTCVAYSTLIMHRRADLYPPISATSPDPATWVPERWETWQPKPWQFIPFNGGPRICIGQQFALVEIAYVVIRLLSEFDRIVDCGNDDVKLGISIVLAPYPGVRIGFAKDKEKL